MADAFDDQVDDPFDDFFQEPEPEEIYTRPGIQLNLVGCFFNLLSGILVTGTLIVGLVFAIIFINPQSNINPLPPTTLPALFRTYTPSPTPLPVLPPTWTPKPDPTQATPKPTETPMAVNTSVPTADLESGTTFRVQDGSPQYETNTYHPEAGCSWLGVGGNILDLAGEPVQGILVEAGGSLGGVEISRLSLSGTAPDYGEAGYELPIYNSPIESNGEAWIQLLDQANLPLTQKIYLQTYDSCDSNLIRINFVQNEN